MSESHSLSNSALLSLSVGSIIRAVLTGQDTVGAWKPIVKLRNWTLSSPFKRTVLTVFRKIKYDSPIWPTTVRPNTKATDHNVLSRFFVVMAPITYFSALGTCYIFSRFAPVTRFPALFYQSLVFTQQATCFPAISVLVTCYLVFWAVKDGFILHWLCLVHPDRRYISLP